jgi:hypothetical protein
MMNLKGCERKRLWLNLRYYPGIYVEWLRKTTKHPIRVAGLRAKNCTNQLKWPRFKKNTLAKPSHFYSTLRNGKPYSVHIYIFLPSHLTTCIRLHRTNFYMLSRGRWTYQAPEKKRANEDYTMAHIISAWVYEVLSVRKILSNKVTAMLLSSWVQVWTGWTHKATLAPRPFSDLLCVPICLIPPVVPYLWQSTLSCITGLGSTTMFTYVTKSEFS